MGRKTVSYCPRDFISKQPDTVCQWREEGGDVEAVNEILTTPTILVFVKIFFYECSKNIVKIFLLSKKTFYLIH